MSPTSYQAAPPRINGPQPSRRRARVSSGGGARRAARAAPSSGAAARFRGCTGAAHCAILPRLDRAGVRVSNVPDMPRRFELNRFRLAAVLAVTALALAAGATQVRAAAEVHQLNLVLSAHPDVDQRRGLQRADRALQPASISTRAGSRASSQITFGWLFDAELRYFVRPNIAVEAGVGQLHASQKQRVPARASGRTIQIRAEIALGADPRRRPPTTSRPTTRATSRPAPTSAAASISGGLQPRADSEQVEVGTDTLTTLRRQLHDRRDPRQPRLLRRGRRAHVLRRRGISVLLGAVYRSVDDPRACSIGTELPARTTAPSWPAVPARRERDRGCAWRPASASSAGRSLATASWRGLGAHRSAIARGRRPVVRMR